MTEVFFASQASKLIYYLLINLSRVLLVTVVCLKCDFGYSSKRNAFIVLTIFFPIITSIVCMVKYKRSAKDAFVILFTLIFILASVMGIGAVYRYYNSEKFYDREGTRYTNFSDMVYTDADGNKYTYDFEKTGYDYLRLSSTGERLNSDFCYLDSNGYLYYDDDMSISVKDENCCADEDGSLYYPVRFTTFNKDGTIKYNFFKGNFKYDRLAKAYTYDYVPYYDTDGNKYSYSFDSSTQKGTYTNVSTGEAFENEYSFVDENGYFVYDKEHSFIEQKDVKNVKTYKDATGQIYYWASGVSWDENGNLLDSYGDIIE